MQTETRLLKRSYDKGDCRVWVGGKHRAGYGYIKILGKQRLTHRIAYELAKGKIPEGYQIDHLCKNPSCINPAHLEAVTQRENILRSDSFAAINSHKMACNRGHLLIGNNVYVKKNGARNCRKCRALSDHKRYLMKKELSNATR